MCRPNKHSGIGFSPEPEPEPSTVLPLSCHFLILPPSLTTLQNRELDPASAEFLEGQTLYRKIRSEIQAQITTEIESSFRASMTSKMKAEIRRGMVLDVQEEGCKLLASQKKKLIEGLRKEVRKEIEKELGLESEREERLRERVRRVVSEEIRGSGRGGLRM
jgi:hypothetical protein